MATQIEMLKASLNSMTADSLAAIKLRDDRIVELEEALREAIDAWASHLNAMPSVRGRKRLDEVRALVGDED